jgi:hypothetical protein
MANTCRHGLHVKDHFRGGCRAIQAGDGHAGKKKQGNVLGPPFVVRDPQRPKQTGGEKAIVQSLVLAVRILVDGNSSGRSTPLKTSELAPSFVCRTFHHLHVYVNHDVVLIIGDFRALPPVVVTLQACHGNGGK